MKSEKQSNIWGRILTWTSQWENERWMEKKVLRPPKMNAVFEAEECLSAPSPNTRYTVVGWRVMIVYSEKYISEREREWRWLERSLLSQCFFVFPGSRWELMMEFLFIHPFFLFYHIRWVHSSFYYPPAQKSCFSAQIFPFCSLWESNWHGARLATHWMLDMWPHRLFGYPNCGLKKKDFFAQTVPFFDSLFQPYFLLKYR